MPAALKTKFALGVTLAALAGSIAFAQETPELPATPVAVEAGTPAPVDADTATPAINEDEMADLLNSRQQIKQDVTLTKSVDGKVIETKTQTITYSKDDPLRDSEAGLSPIERLKAEFDSQSLTRKEALDEARLDFVVGDLDRNEDLTADEFVFLVKGWQDAEVSGSGRGRFVDPFFHVDQASADAEHAAQARAKFALMAGEAATMNKKRFTRRIVEEFEAHDLDKDELLTGDELLNFRAAVRGEPVTPQ